MQPGSERCVARHGERISMPLGMLCRQNPIGSPNTCVAIPARLKCAATESPYGPAPMTATLQFLACTDVMLRSFDQPPLRCLTRRNEAKCGVACRYQICAHASKNSRINLKYSLMIGLRLQLSRCWCPLAPQRWRIGNATVCIAETSGFDSRPLLHQPA